jgi:hypothetical protein
MAKTLGPYVIEELQRLKIGAPPTPAFKKPVSADAMNISRIVAGLASTRTRGIAETDPRPAVRT